MFRSPYGVGGYEVSLDSGTSSDEYGALRIHYATDIDIGSGELWTPFKSMYNILNTAIDNPTVDNINIFRDEVCKCKPHFQTKQLLTSRARNSIDREALKRSISESIYLIGHDDGKILPAQIVNETILLSDLFEINEFHALDLLVTGEAEMSNYPCWPRGLVAVYIYLEGQFSIVATFRTMLKICPGNTWGSSVHPKIVDTCNSTLDQALTEDLMDKVLNLMDKYDIKKQMESLDSHLGLGDWRHRTGVLTYLKSLREILAEILFCWSAQRGLGWPDTMRILEFLKTHIVLKEEQKICKEDVYLLSAILYAIDYNMNTERFNMNFVVAIRKYYLENMASNAFLCPEILDVVRLAFHVAVHKRLAETSLNSLNSGITTGVSSNELLDNEELDFKTDVFDFLKSELFSDTETFAKDEHVVRLFHQLFGNFISFMPAKLKEMKNQSEESWRLAEMYNEQGLNRPMDLPQEYENFLESVGVFYGADTRFELARDYFRPEPSYGSLNKLVRGSCLDTAAMFLPNVKMLAGLGKSFSMGVFEILKQPGHNLSLDHFYDSITKYLQTVGSQLLGDVSLPTTHNSIYQSDMFQRVVMNPSRLKPSEILSICAYLDLLKSVCTKNFAQLYFTTTKKQWFQLTLISVKERGFPREIRIQLLDAASCMISREPTSTEYVMTLWEIFYSTGLIEHGTSDLKEELEEKETRLESYALTINFLKLLDALVDARFSTEDYSSYNDSCQGATIDGTLLEPYVTFVRDTVFQKIPYRAYRNIKERWTLTKLALRIVSKLLDFVPNLMIQLLCDCPLLRGCLTVLNDCARVRDLSTGPVLHVDECSYECLNLISRVYARQSTYLYRRDSNVAQYNVILIGIQELLMKVNGETGRAEYLLALLKFVDKLNPETHRDLALQILSRIVSSQSDTDIQLYTTVNSDPNLTSVIRHTLCECLDDVMCPEQVQNDVLELLRSSVIHSSPNFGLFMIGVDKKIDFQNPGVYGFPRTVLHSLLDNLATLSGAFHTLYVLIRDPRLQKPLLRYLRTNQVLVKFYIDHFPSLDMEVESVGYFLKCVSVELKSLQQPGPLTHALVGAYSYKFLSVLEKIEIETEVMQTPSLEFFDNDQVDGAFRTCEYMDRDLKVKLINCTKLEEIFKEDISRLDKAIVLRLRKSIQGEAQEIIAFANRCNDSRRKVASKIFLFDCWRQSLGMLVLSLSSLKLAGVDYITSLLRLVTEKTVSSDKPSGAFHRLAAETTITLCAALDEFKDDLSETVLNLIINNLCAWVAQETSSVNRALLYSSILYVMGLMRKKRVNASSHSSFALIIDALCKDGQSAADVGKMQSMYLLGEIIRWNISKGLGGVVPNSTKNGMFLKNIISSLLLTDDNNLVQLFSTKPGSTHLRSLLVYEAKMFMLTRFAKTGANATQLLLGANIIQRLADMKVFEGGYNLDEDARLQCEYSFTMAAEPAGFMSLPSKLDRMDSLFTSVLTLFHGMICAAPNNETLIQGIWHFITIHDEGLANLIEYPNENDKIGHSLVLLTSLLALIGEKAPENAFKPKAAVYGKLTGVLRSHVRKSGQSFEQLRLIRDVMLFLFNLARGNGDRMRTPEPGEKRNNSEPFQMILSPKMNYSTQTTATNTEIDLSVGLILKIVHDTSKLAYQTYDNEDKRTNYLVGILETGLTLAYWHVEMILKDIFSRSAEFKRDQQIFQRDLQDLMEREFFKDVTEATEIFVNDVDYMKTMLMRLRRLAVLQKY